MFDEKVFKQIMDSFQNMKNNVNTLEKEYSYMLSRKEHLTQNNSNITPTS